MNNSFLWHVVPMSENQKLDIRPSDIFQNGWARLCSTYRGGGGYDQFPVICKQRLGKEFSEQFIIQLRGCVLDCPYCYVTRSGVWGDYYQLTSDQLVEGFIQSGQQTFHLMGGSPASYIDKWSQLLQLLSTRCPDKVFHSDLMGVEKDYLASLQKIKKFNNYLLAFNVKGVDEESWLRNTRKAANFPLFWRNLTHLLEQEIAFYLTFTGASEAEIDFFWAQSLQKLGYQNTETLKKTWFNIPLINYKATKHVDSIPWGASGNGVRKFALKPDGCLRGCQNIRKDSGVDIYRCTDCRTVLSPEEARALLKERKYRNSNVTSQYMNNRKYDD